MSKLLELKTRVSSEVERRGYAQQFGTISSPFDDSLTWSIDLDWLYSDKYRAELTGVTGDSIGFTGSDISNLVGSLFATIDSQHREELESIVPKALQIDQITDWEFDIRVVPCVDQSAYIAVKGRWVADDSIMNVEFARTVLPRQFEVAMTALKLELTERIRAAKNAEVLKAIEECDSSYTKVGRAFMADDSQWECYFKIDDTGDLHIYGRCGADELTEFRDVFKDVNAQDAERVWKRVEALRNEAECDSPSPTARFSLIATGWDSGLRRHYATVRHIAVRHYLVYTSEGSDQLRAFPFAVTANGIETDRSRAVKVTEQINIAGENRFSRDDSNGEVFI